MTWIKENKRLAYTIGGVVAVVVILILLAKFWVYSIVGVVCLGIGYYYGRVGFPFKKKAINKNDRQGFL